MDDSKISQAAGELVAQNFEIELKENEQLNEQQMFDLIADHVAWLIEYRLDYLLSMLYRLDVLEVDINRALSPGAPLPANIGLTQLIIERQKQRIRTKQQYKVSKLDDLEEGLEF